MWTWSGVVLPIFTMASVMAAVISRFCWSVRPAYHWIVMFGMARLLGVDRVGCGRDYRSARSVGQGAGLRPAWPGTTATFAGLTPANEPNTSSTGSYQAIHDKADVQAHQKDVEGALDQHAGAHALGTYGRNLGDKADERRRRAMLDDLLRAAAGAAGSVRRGVGVGRLVEFRVDRRRGSALVAEGQVVHVAIV